MVQALVHVVSTFGLVGADSVEEVHEVAVIEARASKASVLLPEHRIVGHEEVEPGVVWSSLLPRRVLGLQDEQDDSAGEGVNEFSFVRQVLVDLRGHVVGRS